VTGDDVVICDAPDGDAVPVTFQVATGVWNFMPPDPPDPAADVPAGDT